MCPTVSVISARISIILTDESFIFRDQAGSLVCGSTYPHFVKGILTFFFFFLEIGSFYNSPRVKQFGFTVFKSIQPIF